MPSATVDAAIMGRLASQWTQSPVLGLNAVTEPPQGSSAFLVVQYPISDGIKPVLGNRHFEEGVARFVLNVASGTGLDYGLVMADTLAALFRDVKFSGVEMFEPSAPIINDQNDDGNWFELAVVVPYRYQF